jgi:hypothetical protein
MILYRIISGGQTGADRGALEGARACGIPTGGVAPKGWRTERGPDPDLAAYNLKEGRDTGYAARTYRNVFLADGTVLFGNTSSAGSRCTVQACAYYKRPCLTNPTVEQFLRWLTQHDIRTVNVAGNRESRLPGIAAQVEAFVKAVWATGQIEIPDA